MLDYQAWVTRLRERSRRFPKWAWGLAVLATILVIALLVNPGKEAGAGGSLFSDPTLNSTSLAAGVFLKFGFVLVLLYAGYYLLRRWQAGRPGGVTRRVKVLETHYLNPRRSIHLVQVSGRTILIGATDQSINLLADIDPLDETESEALPSGQPASNFADLLQNNLRS